jgi:hypothetical protein
MTTTPGQRRRPSAVLTTPLIALALVGAAAVADQDPSPSPTPAPAAALVLRVEGAPFAVAPGPAAPGAPLAPLDWLAAGSQVDVPEGGAVELVLANGARYHLPAGTLVLVRETSLETRQGAPQRLPAAPPLAPVPPIAAMGRTALTAVRIRAGGFPTLHPGGGARVLADDAELRYTSSVPATTYGVELEDLAGRVLLALETRETEVAIPAGVLRPGETYLWRVRTRDPSGMLLWEEERFTTFTAEEAAARQRLATTVEAAGDTTGWLALAGVDRGLGLTRMALVAVERALELAPDDAGLVAARRRLAAEAGAPE